MSTVKPNWGRLFFLAYVACLVPCLEASAADKDLYAAISFSRSTGAFGVVTGQPNISEARAGAVRSAKAADAQMVVYTINGFCALAVANDNRTFGVGRGKTLKEAEGIALRECRRIAGSARIRCSTGAKGGGTCSAIAYSPRTGATGSAFGKATVQEARTVALKGCRAVDARIVVFCAKGYCALAVSRNSTATYAVGLGPTKAHAERTALNLCRKRDPDCKIELVFGSD